MNKTFKVLWNKARCLNVVTNEHQRSRGKGKVKSIVTVGGSAAATLSAAAAFVSMLTTAGGALAATTITPGWTNTEVTTTGNVTEVVSKYGNGQAAVNKFSAFTLDAGHIANLRMGDYQNLMNFVNAQITIDGTVNAIKDGKIGGNLFFISPQGIAVGSTGVINAGSLTLSTPTAEVFNRVYNDSNPTISDVTLEAYRTGDVPLNPTAVITVAGSINAGNRVMLSSGSVSLGATAKVTTGVSDFGSLVNITDQTGAVTANSGITDTSFTVDAQSGDVVILARADGTLTGEHTSSASMSATDITNTRPNEEMGAEVGEDQLADANGTTHVNVVSASVDIANGARVRAGTQGKIRVEAAAGAGEYVTGSVNSTDGTSFKATKDMQSSDVRARVSVAGTLTASQGLTVRSFADNQLDHGMGFNMATFHDIVGSVMPSFTGSSIMGERITLKTSSTADIADTATLTTYYGDADVSAVAHTDAKAGNSSSLTSLFNWGSAESVPTVSSMAATIDSSATTHVAGKIYAVNDINISATDTLRAALEATANTGNTPSAQSAFVLADIKGAASTVIDSTADFGWKKRTSEELGYVDNLTIKSYQWSDVVTQADAQTGKKGNAGISANITKFNTEALTTMNAAVPAGRASNITIKSDNYTDTLQTRAKTSVGDETFLMKMKAKVVRGMLGGERIANIAGMFGASTNEAQDNTSKIAAGGAFNYTQNSQSSNLNINADLTASSALTLGSTSTLADHRYVATTKQEKQDEAQQSITGSVAILINTPGAAAQSSEANLNIAAGLTLLARTIDISNSATIDEQRYKEIIEELEEIWAKYIQTWERSSIYETHLKEMFDAWAEMKALRAQASNANAFVSLQKQMQAMGKFGVAVKKAMSLPADAAKNLGSLVAPLFWALIDVANPASYTNVTVMAGGKSTKAQDKLTAFDGGFAYVGQATRSHLTVGEGVTLTATDTAGVKITGESSNGNIVLGGITNTMFGVPIGQLTQGNSFGATVLYQSLSTDNRVSIAKNAKVRATTGTVDINAKDGIDAYTVAASAGMTKSGSTFAGLAAVGVLSGANLLEIDDSAQIRGYKDVSVRASREDDVVSTAADLNFTTNSEGAAAAIGAGVAVALGDLSNKLTVKSLDESNVGGGFIKSDTEDLRLAAEDDLTVNIVGAALLGAKSGSSGGSQEGGSSSGTGSETGTGSGSGGAPATSGAEGLTGVIDQLDGMASTLERVGNAAKTAAAAAAGTPAAGTASAFADGLSKAVDSKGIAKLRAVKAKAEALEESSKSLLGQNQKGAGGLLDSANPAESLKGVGKFSGGATLGGSGAGSAASGSGGGGGKLAIAGAGSFAWNDLNGTNSVTINSSKKGTAEQFALIGRSVDVYGTFDKWMGAWAGAGALAINGNSGAAVSVAGAAAVNKGDFVNTTDIDGLTIDADSYKNSVSNDGTSVAEGLGVSMAKSGKAAVGITAGVSYNRINNTVSATAKHITVSNAAATHTHDTYVQKAWNGETQVTGGTGIGVAAGSSGAAAIGAAIAIADNTNTVSANLDSSTLSGVRLADVGALGSLTQVNTAVGVQAAIGKGVALNGSFSQANLTNNFTAGMSNTTLVLTSTGSSTVRADAIDHDTGFLEARSLWQTEEDRANLQKALTWAIRIFGNEGDHDPNSLKNQEYIASAGYRDVTDPKNDPKGGETVSATKYLENGAMRQTSVAVGVAASTSAGGAGSGSVIINNVDNDFTVNAANVNVSGGATSASDVLKLLATNDVRTVSVGAGIAASGGQGAIAGTVIVGDIKQNATVNASGITSSTKGAALLAKNTAQSVNFAGNISAQVGSSGAAVGAAVIVESIESNARATLANSAFTNATKLSVKSVNDAFSVNAGINGAIGSNAAIGGSVVVTNVENHSETLVDTLSLTSVGALEAKAEDTSETDSLAGSIAVSVGEGGAGLAAGVAVTNDTGSTSAKVKNLTIVKTGATRKTDLTVDASTTADIRTMTLAMGGAPVGAGIAGAVSVNKIAHTTSASGEAINEERATPETALTHGSLTRDLSITATNDAQIGSLGVVVSGTGIGAAIGAGVSVNTIESNTSAALSSSTLGVSRLRVESQSLSDIDAVGVGVSGTLSGVALGGSTATNKVRGSTLTTISGNTIVAGNGAIVNALGDVTTGTYLGQASLSGGIAGGLTLGITDNSASVKTTVDSSSLSVAANDTRSTSFTAKSAVENANINDEIVEEGGIATATTLRDHLTDVSGANALYVGSSSTATYKGVLVGIAVSGGGTGQGTANAITHAGETSVAITGSSALSSAGALTIHSGDYTNYNTVLSAGALSAGVSLSALVDKIKSNRTVGVTVTDSSASATGDLTLTNEAKEGKSSLLIQLSGAGILSAAAIGADTKFDNNLAVSVARSSLTAGGALTLDNKLLSRTRSLSVAANVSGIAAGAAVILNSTNSSVLTRLSDSAVSGSSVSVLADRNTNFNYVKSGTNLSILASAGIGVNVNTVDGYTGVVLEDTAEEGRALKHEMTVDARTGALKIEALNHDNLNSTAVDANISTTVLAMGAGVYVNNLSDAANVFLDGAKLNAATDMTVRANQERDLRMTSTVASLGANYGLAINVLVNRVGNMGESAGSLLASSIGADDGNVLSEKIQNAEGFGSDTSGLGASAAASEIAAKLNAANGWSTSAAFSSLNTEGTHVSTRGSSLVARGATNVSATEDMDGASVDATFGAVAASGAAAASAQVMINKRVADVGVALASSTVQGTSGLVLAESGGTDTVHAVQGAVSLAGATAGYAGTDRSGTVAVAADASTLAGVNVAARVSGTQFAQGQGVAVGFIAGGAMIARANDAVNAAVTITGSTLTGDSVTAERAQTSRALALAGFGGVIGGGAGADAAVKDTGSATLTMSNGLVKHLAAGSSFAAVANNHPELIASAESAGGALGAAVGIVESSTLATGSGTLTVSGTRFNVPKVTLTGVSGLSSERASDALRMSTTIEGYGGAMVGLPFNTATETNKTSGVVNILNIAGVDEGASDVGVIYARDDKGKIITDTVTDPTQTDLNGQPVKTTVKRQVDANWAPAVNIMGGAHASYDVTADAFNLGLVAVGSNAATVNHQVSGVMNISNVAANALGSVDADLITGQALRVYMTSAGGGLVPISPNVIVFKNNDAATNTMNIAGTWRTVALTNAVDGSTISTGLFDAGVTSSYDLKIRGDNTMGAFGGGSGVTVENNMGTSARHALSALNVASGTVIDADGALNLAATSNWTMGGNGTDFIVDSEVYGAGVGATIGLTNNYWRDNRVNVGRGSQLSAGTNLTLDAHSNTNLNNTVRARTAGAVAVVGGTLDTTTVLTNVVDVSENVALSTESASGGIYANAWDSTTMLQTALARVEGAAIVSSDTEGSRGTAYFTRYNTVKFAGGAKARSAGEVMLAAGMSRGGVQSALDLRNHVETYAAAGAGHVKASITSDTILNDTVTVDAGANVQAATKATLVADPGDYLVAQSAEENFWGNVNNNSTSQLAVRGVDTANAAPLKDQSLLTVNGTVEAGLLTKMNIKITGVLLPSGVRAPGGSAFNVTYDIEGDEEAKHKAKLAVGERASETAAYKGIAKSDANIYMSRYQTVQGLIAAYALGGENTATMLAYKAELAALEQIMLANGYAERDDSGTLRPIASAGDTYLAIGKLATSGGDISITAGKMAGSGAIKANAAAGISIVNESNVGLDLKGLSIESKGGNLTLNTNDATQTDLAAKGFTGTVKSSANSADPTISVSSNSKVGTIRLTGSVTEDGITKTYSNEAVTPSTSVLLDGGILNRAGDITFSVQKNITSLSSAGVSAAKSLTMDAGGAITQSHTAGLQNIGGGVEWQYGWKENELRNLIANDLSNSNNNAVSWGVGPGSFKGWYAGGAVFINADMLNINGTIQSGYATYTLGLTSAELQAAIERVTTNWLKYGKPRSFSRTGLYQISTAGATTNSGLASMRVNAWYNPNTQTIVVEDIKAKGGYISLVGRIGSTGQGQLIASSGKADLNIDAPSYNVQLGAVDTRGSAGTINVTDYSWADQRSGQVARVYEYKQEANAQGNLVTKATYTDVYKTGKRNPVSIGNTSSLDIRDGLAYVWTNGTKNVEVIDEYWYRRGGLWGAVTTVDYASPDKRTVTQTGASELTRGATLVTGYNLHGQTFWGGATVVSTDKPVVKEWENRWTSGFLGWFKHRELFRKTTKGTMTLYTYGVNASRDVGVSFAAGQNKVTVNAKSIALAGDLTSTGATVKLTAGTGSITATNSSARILGAQNLTLSATGNIGSSTRALALAGGTGTLTLNATSNTGSIYLDGSKLGSGTTVVGNLIAEKGDLSATMRGTMNLSNVSAQNIQLNSTEGGVKVTSLKQKVNRTDSQRLDIDAHGAVTIISSTNLGVGKIDTHGGDLSMTVAGSLYDASGQTESTLEADRRYQGWVTAGLINQDGSDATRAKYASDVEAARQAVRSEYDGYLKLKATESEKLSDAQRTKLAALEEKFGSLEVSEAFAAKFEQMKSTLSMSETELAAAGTEAQAFAKTYAGATTAGEALALAAARADSTSALAKLENPETASHYGWTANDLLYAVSDTIINQQAGATNDMREVSNIYAKNVTLKVSGANIGKMGQTVTGNLNNAAERVLLLKELSKADVGDFTAGDDGALSVTLKKPVQLTMTGTLNAAARDNVWLSSPESITLDRVSAAQSVRVIANSGIESVANAMVSAKNITLRGGTGNLGSANVLDAEGNVTSDRAIRIVTSEGGWAALSGGGTTNVMGAKSDGTLGDLTFYALAGTTVNVRAKNLYAYTSNPEGILDADKVSIDELGYIKGETLNLDVAGEFGRSSTQRLRFGAGSTVNFTGTITQFYARAKGAGTLTIGGLDATGAVDLLADGAVALGDMKGSTVTVSAAGDVTAQGNLASRTGALSLSSTGGAVTVAAGSELDAKTTLTLAAEGGELSVLGGESLAKENIHATDAVTLKGTSVLATGGWIKSDAGAVTLEATDTSAGQVSAENLKAEAAGDVTLISAKDVLATSSAFKSTSGNLVFDTTGNVNVEGSSLEASSITLESETGSINAKDATIRSGAAATISSGLGVNLEGAAVSATSLSLTSGADIAAKGLVASLGTGEMEVSSTGETVLENAELTAASVTATAAGTLNVAGATLTNAAATIKSAGADIAATGLKVVNGKATTLDAATSVALDSANIAATSLDVDARGAEGALTAENLVATTTADTSLSGVGSVTANSAAITAKNAELTGVGTLTAHNVKLTTTAGKSTLKSTGSTVDMSGAETLVKAAELDALAHGTLTATNAQIEGAAATIKSTGADIAATGLKVVNGKATTLDAATSVALDSANIAATSLDVDARGAAGALTATNLVASTTADASLSGAGSVTATGAAITAKNAELIGTGALSAQNVKLTTTTGKSTVKSTGSTVDMSGTGTLIKAETLEAEAHGTLTATNAQIEGAAATIKSAAADIAATGLKVVNGQATTIAGKTGVVLDRAQVGAASLSVTTTGTGADISAAGLSSNTTGDTTLSSSDAINANGAEITAANAELTGVGALTAQGVKLTTTAGKSTLKSTGSTVDMSGAGTLVKAAELDALAHGKLTATNAEIQGAAATIKSAAADIAATGLKVVSGKATVIDAATSVALDNANIAGTSLDVDARGVAGALTATNLVASTTADASLSGAGSVTATGAAITAKNAELIGTGALSAQNVKLTTTTGKSTVKSTGSTVDMSGTGTLVKAAELEALAHGTLTATNAEIQGAAATIKSTAADIAATGLKVVNGKVTTIDAATSVALDSANIAAASLDVDARGAAGALTATNLVATTAGLTALDAAGSLDMSGASTHLTAATLTATAAGTLTATGATVDGAAATIKSTAADIAATGLKVVNGQATTIAGKTGVVLDRAQVGAASLSVTTTGTGADISAAGLSSNTTGDTTLSSSDAINANGAEITAANAELTGVGALTAQGVKLTTTAGKSTLKSTDSTVDMSGTGTLVKAAELEALAHGTLTATNAQIEGAAATIKSAAADIAATGLKVVNGQATTIAGKTGVVLDRAQVGAASLSVTTTGTGADISAAGLSSNTTGDTTLSSSDAINANGAEITAANAELTGVGALTAQGVKLTTTAGKSTLKSTDSTVDMSGTGTLVKAAELEALAHGTLTATNAQIEGAAATIKSTAADIAATGLKVVSGKATTIDAATSVALDSANIAAASLDVDARGAAGALSATNLVATTTGFTALDAAGSLDMSGASTHLTAATLTATAAGTLTATGATVDGAAATIKSTAADIAATGLKVVNGQATTIAGKTGVVLDRAQVGAASLSVTTTGTGADISAAGLSSNTTGDTTLSSSDAINANGAEITAANAELTGVGALTAQGVKLTTTAGKSTLKSTDSTVDMSGAGTLVKAAELDALAHGKLTATNAQIEGAAATIKSTAADIAATGLKVVNGQATTIAGKTGVVLDRAQVGAASLSVTTTGTGADISAAGLSSNTTGDTTLSSGDGINATGAAITAANAKLTGAGAVSAQNVKLTTTAGKSTVKSTDSTVDMSGAETLVKAAELEALAHGKLTATNAQIEGAAATLKSTAADIAATGLKVVNGKTTAIDAATSVALDSANIAATSLDVDARGAAGALTAENLVASTTADTSLSGAGSVTATGAAITAANAELIGVGAVSAQNVKLTTTAGKSTVKSTDSTVDMSGTGTLIKAATLEAEAHGTLTATNAEIQGAAATIKSTAADIAAEGLKVVNGKATALEAKTGVDIQEARIAATSLTALSETDTVDLTGAHATVTGATVLKAAADSTVATPTADVLLSGVELTSGTLAVTADRSIDAQQATLSTTSAPLGAHDPAMSFTAQGGDVSLSNSHVSTAGGVHATAQKSVISQSVTYSVTGGGFSMNAIDEDLDLVGSTGVAGRYVETTAGRDLKISNLAVTAEEVLRVVTQGDLAASGMTVTLGSEHEAGHLTMKATTGNVDMQGTTVLGNVGVVTAQAGKNLNAQGVFDADKTDPLPTMEKLVLTAGNTIDVGNQPIAITTTGAGANGGISMSAAKLEGEAITAHSQLSSTGAGADIALAFTDTALTVGEGASLSSEHDMSLAVKNLAIQDGVAMQADNAMALESDQSVSATGTVAMLAKALDMSARSGDVTLDGNVVVGDADARANVAAVRISAAGDVTQTEGSGETGLRGNSLDIHSGGAVKIDAYADAQSAGNAFSRLSINAADSIAIGLADRSNTAVAINNETGGVVNGELSVQAQRNGVSLTNNVSGADAVLVHAGAISGGSVSATGEVTLTTSLYDAAMGSQRESGVRMSGAVTGSSVSVSTNTGGVDIGSLTADGGKINVYRQARDGSDARVTFGTLESADTSLVYNGNGDIVGTRAHSANTQYYVVGTGGSVIGRGSFTSDVNKVGLARLGYAFTPEVNIDNLADLSASALPIGNLPFINASETRLAYADRDRAAAVLPDTHEITTPTSSYFFLNARSDAPAAGVAERSATGSVAVNTPALPSVAELAAQADVAEDPVASIVSATEAAAPEGASTSGEEGEEEGSATRTSSPLVNGLPTAAEPMIRDLRNNNAETTQDEDLSWLVSLNSANLSSLNERELSERNDDGSLVSTER